MTLSALAQLKQFTTVVADSSDLDAIRQFRPLDATTNPSLITAAAKQPENQDLIAAAYQQAKRTAKEQGLDDDATIEHAIDILTVQFGVEILKLIDGRVSTEVDAALSYDTEATISKAHELLALYATHGIDPKRVLIKIASTWQGIQAAKVLQAQGIQCNLTLLFGLHQAQACAEAKVTLISPFVGRILDWYKKAEGVDQYPMAQDPGVLSVKSIYYYFKQQNIQTQVMGASFRSSAQVLALTGCDLLTIAPALLAEMDTSQQTVHAQLTTDQALAASKIERAPQDQTSFEAELNADPMASQLLSAGIDGFVQARLQLKQLLQNQFMVTAV